MAQVVLGKDQTEQALQLVFGDHVGQILQNTPQLHDGRWLFIPVLDAQDCADVEQLLLVKKRPVRRKQGTP